MRKRIGLWIMAAALAAGCSLAVGHSAQAADQKYIAESDSSHSILRESLQDRLKKADEEKNEKEEQGKKKTAVGTSTSRELTVSLETEKDILTYLAGTWAFTDQETGEDYASLTIRENGSCTFERDGADAVCDGTLTFQPLMADASDAPDGYRITFEEIPDEYMEGYQFYGSVESSGLFYTGRSAGEDYLYLEEIGNGDTFMSVSLFQSERIRRAADSDRSYSWILRRANRIQETQEDLPDRSCYAFVWSRDEDGAPLAQVMQPIEEEMLEDYTNRRFTGGRFEEMEEIGVQKLSLTDRTDLSLIEHIGTWESAHPMMMVQLEADRTGAVTKVSEVPRSFYGIYNLGDLEPEYSWKDRVFTYNGAKYDLADYDTVANAIMDCFQVGDWIVAECHVNPHVSQYLFFSLASGEFEEGITGANLIWQGEDLSTAVYSAWSEIYDYKGHVIGQVQEGEIFDLSFSDDGKYVLADCWKIENGEEVTFTEEFEYEYPDEGMYRYKDWRRHRTPENWKALLEEAPEDAQCLILVNPPADVPVWAEEIVTVEEGALDHVYVLALKDNTRVRIDRGETIRLNQGQLAEFAVTVPEGMPSRTMTVTTDEGKAEWQIATLSGRIAQDSKFLVSGE